MSPLFVICAFRPKPGQQDALLAAVKKHMMVLRGENLVTDRPAYVMKADDGTILAVFEWKSQAAIDAAHRNSNVHKLWAEFEAACNYIPLNQVPETSQMFANFDPIAF